MHFYLGLATTFLGAVFVLCSACLQKFFFTVKALNISLRLGCIELSSAFYTTDLLTEITFSLGHYDFTTYFAWIL